MMNRKFKKQLLKQYSNNKMPTSKNNGAEIALKIFLEEEKQKNPDDSSAYTSSNNNNIDVENIINTSNNNNRESFLKHEQDFSMNMDEYFLIFLSNFVKTQNEKEQQKTIFKEQFFWIVMIGFLSLLLTPMILIISLKSLSQITAVVSLVTIFFELVSAIIVLPKIIAEYLFNKQEDEKLMQIIESMQKYNQDKQKHINE